MSGAALSQYLQMSRYVNKYFKPDVFVINVVHNDFDESLFSVRSDPYFLEIEIVGSEPRESMLANFPVSAKSTTKLVFKSSIFRYLWHNLNFDRQLTELGLTWYQNGAAQQQLRAHAQPTKDSLEANHRDIVKAVDYIVRKMRAEDSGKELIFLLDAPRRDIYRGTLHESEVLWMNKLIKQLCEYYNCKYVDLTEPFLKSYEKNKVKFNSDYDYHWNEEGHKLAAEHLYQSLINFVVVNQGCSA
jgi:hypothetical protein